MADEETGTGIRRGKRTTKEKEESRGRDLDLVQLAQLTHLDANALLRPILVRVPATKIEIGHTLYKQTKAFRMSDVIHVSKRREGERMIEESKERQEFLRQRSIEKG
jgi:hypothetical protein